MHLREFLDQREPDSEPPLGARRRPISLNEQIEDVGNQLGRHADARITNLDDQHLAFELADTPICPPASVYLAALLSKFTRICSSRSGSALSRRPGSSETVQFVLALLQNGPNGLDGAADDRSESDLFLLEPDLPACDSGHVQKVVDQPRKMLDLPEDHLLGPDQVLLRTRRFRKAGSRC